MKRILALVLTLSMLLCIPVAASAATETEIDSTQTKVVWNADGSRTEITLKVFDPAVSTYAAKGKYTRGATNQYDYYDTKGDHAYTYTLIATFEFDEVSYSKATKASATYSIKKSGWQKVSSNVSRSGDTAYADGTFKGNGEYDYPSLMLSCDPDGNISY